MEQIASNAVNSKNIVDDDVLADPIPVIPKSMQSQFSQIKVSSQNFNNEEKEKTEVAKKEPAGDAATPSVNPPDSS